MSKKSFELNPRQLQAVTTTTGPLLVLAGAGTGKTRVVTERMAYLLRKEKVSPDNIIAVTFTNKAAAEMRERLQGLTGKGVSTKGIIVSTFHSLCVRILRRDAERIGYRPHFTICDQGEQVSIIRRAMRDVAGIEKMRPDDVLSIISRLKSGNVSPEQYQRTAIEEFEHTVSAAYRKYQNTLKATNSMDFDDLQLNALAILRGHPEALEYWQDRARYMLVDEFQDTNEVQMEFVRLLAAKHRNICVVGDDDQSIYSWRGARPQNIINFERTFPGATVVRLEENYRSVNSVLKAANALIANNDDRVGKTLWSGLGRGELIEILENEDPDQEAERIAKRIYDAVKGGASPADHAILIRTNGQSRPLEEELRMQRLPYTVIGGQSFFDRKEVRDVLAFLSVIANPDADGALMRVINTPSRGLGSKSLERLAREALVRKLPLRRMLAEAKGISDLPAVAVKGATKLAGALEECEKLVKGHKFCDVVPALLEGINYQKEVEHLYDDPMTVTARMDSAREVADSLASFLERNPGGDLSSFLQEATLDREDDDGKDKDIAKKSVKIITLHSAKGLEFPVVYLAGMQQGLLPHKNSLEEGDIAEERRLAYVGITRARKQLFLSYSQTIKRAGKSVKVEPSQFIAELPQELLRRRPSLAGSDEALDHLAAIRAALGDA